MPEVPEHLVPADGLTNFGIRFAGFDVIEDGAADMRFEMTDESKLLIGTITVTVDPTRAQTVDSMIAEGHRHVCDVLRQWLYRLDVVRKAYEKR